MSNNKCISVGEFDASKVKFGEVKKNQKGGKNVGISYVFDDNTAKKFRIKVDNFKCSFGISGWNGKSFSTPTEETNDTIAFSLSDKENLEMFKKIDELVLENVLKKAEELFGPSKSKGGYVMRDMDNLCASLSIKMPKDETKGYAPTVQAKLYKTGNKYNNITYYTANGEKKILTTDNQAELIPKGSVCKCVLECGGVWVVGGRSGLTWRIAQIKVKPNEEDLGDDILNSDVEDYEEVETNNIVVKTSNINLDDELDNQIDDLDVGEPVITSSTPKKGYTRKTKKTDE